MKHTKFIAVIVAVASVAVSGAALAKGGGHHGPKMSFEEIDADGNGTLTKAEFEALKETRFKATDSDGDGKLSLQEMQAHAQDQAEQRAARMLERFDKNGDGGLSMDELPKPRRGAKMFDHMDGDGSGGISKQEFEEARMNHGGKRRPKKGSDGAGAEQD